MDKLLHAELATYYYNLRGLDVERNPSTKLVDHSRPRACP